jgi:hypothetical protein
MLGLFDFFSSEPSKKRYQTKSNRDGNGCADISKMIY